MVAILAAMFPRLVSRSLSKALVDNVAMPIAKPETRLARVWR
jgi:hypothetical protein